MSTQAQTREPQKSAAKKQSIPERIQESEALHQAIDHVRCSIRANPEAAALWCLGIGFVIGWKLRAW